MTPDISSMEAEIAEQQASLQQLRDRKNAASAIYASALAQRPAGLDPSWLPDFTVSAGSARVVAWFDPSFFGNRLNRS